MVRLLGEVATVYGNHDTRKRHLMDGLALLVEADCWIWTSLDSIVPGKPANVAGMLHNGFSDKRLANYFVIQEHPEMAEFNKPFAHLCQQTDRQITRTRQDLDPKNDFSESAIQTLWKEADIGPLILSAKPFAGGFLSVAALYRRFDDPRFSEREARIAHIILSEVPWLHASDWPRIQANQTQLLAPRLATVLGLLLEGLGRKQIAAHLGISENTISGYIRDLYRFYDVHSHAQLIRHFQKTDPPPPG